MLHRRAVSNGLLAGVALVSLCGEALAQERAARPASEAVEIKATAIASFEKANPDRRRFGRLEFRGGLVLTSDNKKFGGLSDLVVAKDGGRFTAISDGGNWISGEIVYEGLSPKGVVRGRLGPLLAMSGRVLESKRNHDAEAMTLFEGTLTGGRLLIAFERNQRIGRFPVRDGAVLVPTSYLKLPTGAARMKSNRGFEAVTVLRGGRYKGSVLAIAERLLDTHNNHTGWLWIGHTPRRIAIANSGTFDITSAVALADGSVIILERFFNWSEGIKMRLRYLKQAALTGSAPADGETLFEADMGYEIDNMEGLAIHKGPHGEVVLSVVSDNNFNTFLQRTLLLQFTLLAEGLADASAR